MKNLPQFPLRLIAFPQEVVKLHVFENRYRTLVGHCQSEGTSFGITPFIGASLAEYGTEMSLLEISDTKPDGSMDIICRGLRIYKVEAFYNKPALEGYSSADVQFLSSNEISSAVTRSRMMQSLNSMMDVLGDRYKLELNVGELHSSQFIHKLGMDVESEMEILLTLDEDLRLQKLIGVVNKITQQIEHATEIKKRIQLNGHFKKLDPLDL